MLPASPTPASPLTPSELFALAHGFLCDGPDRCHWCGTKCDRRVSHDHQIMPFVRNVHPAKFPGNQYVCLGCEFYRRGSVTVRFPDGTLRDRQRLQDWSLFFTDKEIRAFRPLIDWPALLALLRQPPRRFVLMLIDGPQTNYLQLAKANDLPCVEATTPLAFTLNNVPHAYTVYELERALRSDDEAQEPGTRALLRYLGEVARPAKPVRLSMEVEQVGEKRERGRPKSRASGLIVTEEQRVKAIVRASGT